jgi:phenylalanyl-tRNA synthetase beta chain
MNILIPDSWLREYLDTNATVKDIQRCLSLCGPSVERVHEGNVYDIEVTTNRVDCMSIYGIAREAVAILPQFGFTAVLKPLHLSKLTTGDISGFTIKNNPELCQRILAVKVDNIKVEPSPAWLADKLISVGQRPLNNLVDITNYVMWEMGHPTHVFDFARLITKKMIIREAQKGEKIATLDEKNYILTGGEVIIDDGTGKIIDLPSIMGTANSVVVSTTTSALLFVDDVKSSKVRIASMTHAIRTQAATLLEKDIDPNSSLTAMSRMVYLLKSLYPNAKFSPVLDIYPQPPMPKTISLSLSQITNLIGVEIPVSQIKDILKRLDFQVTSTPTKLAVIPPSHRAFDIQIPEDVIEEIARIYGYHNIPSHLMTGALPIPADTKLFTFESQLKTSLKYLGFIETYTYSLVGHDQKGLSLKNPLSSDWTTLRPDLFPSHKQIITQNLGRVEIISFFEVANVYLPRKNDLPEEQLRLIVSTTDTNYSRFKGKLETLLVDLNIKHFPVNISSDSDILYWEVPVTDLMSKSSSVKTYVPTSKFAPIVEDINITPIGTYSDLLAKITSVSPLIKQIDLIDNFCGKLTLRLTFHSDEKQLSTDDIAPIREKLSLS